MMPGPLGPPPPPPPWQRPGESGDGEGTLDTALERMTSPKPLPERESRNLAGSTKPASECTGSARVRGRTGGKKVGAEGGKNQTTSAE